PYWLDEDQVDRTFAFLSERRMSYVCVDEPQGTRASAPPLAAATAPIAVVRFHGRNVGAWGQRDAGVAEKYDWLYSTDELQAWVPKIQRLANEAETVHVLMNNCREDKAVVNARQLALMLSGGPNPPAPFPRREGGA